MYSKIHIFGNFWDLKNLSLKNLKIYVIGPAKFLKNSRVYRPPKTQQKSPRFSIFLRLRKKKKNISKPLCCLLKINLNILASGDPRKAS